MYIREGSPQEINISGRQKRTLVGLEMAQMDLEELGRVFDLAYEEVVTMISTGVWMDFEMQTGSRGSPEEIKSESIQIV
jgi:hypothetical protein